MFRLKVIELFLFLLLAGCENRPSKADQIKVLEAEITMCNENIAKYDQRIANEYRKTGSTNNNGFASQQLKKFRDRKEYAETELYNLLTYKKRRTEKRAGTVFTVPGC